MTERASNDGGPAADFTLGEWLVQPSLNRIGRGEETVRLRPQLMDVLVCLADRAGQVVTREQILAVVWPNQFVAESGLVRCIAELRQALGDTARADSKYIQTISKRGYRLVAAVAAVPAAAPVPSCAPAALADTALPAVASPAVGRVNVEQEPTGHSERAEQSSVPPGGGRQPQPVRGRRFRLAPSPVRVLATAGAVLLVAGVYMFWPRNVAQTLTGRDTVVLAFDNATGDGVFDGALPLAFAVQLEQSPFLRLLPDSRVREQLRYMGRQADQPVTRTIALEICQREGARAVLAGSLSKLGRQYVIGLEAVGCRSGDTLARQQAEVASKEDVLNGVGRIASALRRDVGESLASVRQYDVPLVQATTASLDALKVFSQAEDARQSDYPQIGRAVPLYRRALEIDPQFALAYARLGTLLRHGLQRQEAVEMFTRAYELRDRVSHAERYDIITQYYASVTGERDRAHETYALWRVAYPRSWLAWYGLASDQLQEARYREAMEGCEQAIGLAPNPALPILCVVRAQMGLNQFDAAEATLQDAFKRTVRSPALHVLHWLNAFARGDTASMNAEVQWSTQSAETQLEMLRAQAWAAASRGRLNECRARLRDAYALAHTVTDGVAHVYIDEAMLEALVGDPRIARTAGQHALTATTHPDLRVMTAIALAAAGDVASATAAIEGVSPGPDDLFQVIVLNDVRARLALWKGRPAEAVQQLEPVRRYELGPYAQLIPIAVRAEAHLRAGQLAEAIQAYEAIIAHRGVHPAAPQGTLAYLGLARAYALAGRPADARKAYAQLFAIWKDADADLPLLVRARAEAEKLK